MLGCACRPSFFPSSFLSFFLVAHVNYRSTNNERQPFDLLLVPSYEAAFWLPRRVVLNSFFVVSLPVQSQPTMSSSSQAIAIPKRKGKHAAVSRHSVDSSSSRSTPSSSSSSSSSASHAYKFTPSANRFEYGSYGSSSSASSTPSSSPGMRRRESLMSEAFSRAEHTVINVGEDECPRLVCVVE